MRYFFLTVLLIFLIAALAEQSKAQPVAMVANQNNGQIIFHDEVCPEQIGLLVEVALQGGRKVHGCWQAMKEGLIVKWTGIEGEPVLYYPAGQVIVFKKGADV